MQPRRLQPAITIRSQKAVDRLKLLTRDGRSQTAVIEEALEKMAEPLAPDTIETIRAQIEKASIRYAARPRRWRTMAEFDEHEYDENGNCR
jgi:hypothetical protein